MIDVVVGDLATHACDAIVRPTSVRLAAVTAAARRVEEVGGREFTGRLTLNRDLVVGAAVVTAAGGGLAAEFVIHAIIEKEGEAVTRAGVARAWLSALQRAQEWGFERLAAPLFGTGPDQLPLADAAEVMVTVLHAHRGSASLPREVALMVESAGEQRVVEGAIRRATASRS